MKEIIIEEISPEEIAMRMFQISLKHSSNYSENQINANQSLRSDLAKKINKEIKEEFPQANKKMFEDAIAILAKYD